MTSVLSRPLPASLRDCILQLLQGNAPAVFDGSPVEQQLLTTDTIAKIAVHGVTAAGAQLQERPCLSTAPKVQRAYVTFTAFSVSSWLAQVICLRFRA